MGIAYLKVYLGLIIFILMGLFFPIYMVNGQVSVDMLLFFCVAFYSALRLALIIRSKNIKMLEMTFYIFVYIFLAIAPLSQILHSEFPWRGIYDSKSILKGGLVVVIGIIIYELGLFFGRRNKNQITLPKKRDVNLKLISVVGVACTIGAIMAKGGFQNLFLPRNELTSAVESLGIGGTSSLIFTVLIRVPVFIALMFALLVYLDKENKNLLLKSNFPLLCLIAFLGILTIIANNPISTARYWVGTIYIGVLFTALKWTRLTQPLFLILILSVLLIIFPYADVFRNSLEFNITFQPLSEIMSQKGDYDSFQQIMNIVDYASYYGITYGMQFLGVLFFWVPRSVWIDKPIGTGATVAEGLGYPFTNVSAPLWSEFYINFGLIGLIVLFFAYGWISSRLQIKYEMSRVQKEINFYRIFVPIFSAYQLFLLRGDLLSSFSYIAPVFIFIFIGFNYKILLRKGYKKSLTTK